MSETQKVEESNSRSGDNLEGMGGQIRSYERQLKEYLEKIDASVDSYNFSIEKAGDGITIELGLRATIRPKRRMRNSEI
jgi:hypothetical protein